MAQSLDTDVAVIGGGIVGFAAAHFLGAHRHVTVLEMEDQPGYHSTGRSAAVLVQAYEGGPTQALTGLSRAYLVAEEAGLAPHPLLSPRGQLVIADTAHVAELEAQAASFGDVAHAFEMIDGVAARALCPMLRPEAVARALWEPGSFDIDVDGLLQAYVRSARRSGAVVCGSKVEALDWDGEAWTVSTQQGSLRAGAIVNAAGGWAGAIGNLAGAAAVPLQPTLRTAVTVDPPAGVDASRWPFVITVREDCYFKPEGGRLMVSLGDERPCDAHDAWPEDLDVALAIDRLQGIAEIDVTRIVRSWAGLRTFAPDRAPVIGWDSAAPNFCWAAGLGGFGVQTSPAIGAIVTNIVAGETDSRFPVTPALRAALSPARFA